MSEAALAMAADNPAKAGAAGADFDVLIVGAGLSGIGAACHLLRKRPQTSFAILEARETIGGTWDLFRYPGIRSDSVMSTFSYAFRPWRSARAIADGPSILRYLAETAQEYAPGTWGPAAADALIGTDGPWRNPNPAKTG